MTEGWILDAHLRSGSDLVTVWVKEDSGDVSEHSFHWSPVIHVSGETRALSDLESFLSGSVCRSLFGTLGITRERLLISHDCEEPVEVLCIRIPRASSLMSVARAIADKGRWDEYEVFSVDPKPAQRFLHDMGTHPFGRVRIGGGRIYPLDSRTDKRWKVPDVKVVLLSFELTDVDDVSSNGRSIRSVVISEMPAYEEDGGIRMQMTEGRSVESFVSEVERALQWLDPDIVVTEGGDTTGFPALISMASSAGMEARLGRKKKSVVLRRDAVTTWSYGRVVRSEAYHALEGRVHIDRGSSFIFKEGGIEGLFEISRMSGIPCQDLSRLSPGSAISAIQVRQSMEDGVLVPWKKNRPEDMKTGRKMVLADRGGLYLDPLPGVHERVYELDFSSLFPSIIATRNISPETVNCSCCSPSTTDRGVEPLPLSSENAAVEIRTRMSRREGMVVPELGYHTCMRRHGFLGRVVSPIIEMRSELKKRVKTKGDPWDRRQNALKWLLVTCFGYTGYRNARFGRIECHEAICSWSRDILLGAKSLAEEEGWGCLHAIVDSIWLKDEWGRDKESQAESIGRLLYKIEKLSGIPIELEDVYDWIAFVPNRTTGSSSLTKYFAYGEGGWKIRGVELRQHSTCEWVKDMQMRVLSEINERGHVAGVEASLRYYRREAVRMREGVVPRSELIISRRVRSDLLSYKVLNLTAAALMRERKVSAVTPPGRKVRFAVVGRGRSQPEDRVRMRFEILSKRDSVLSERGDCEYYLGLASRAIFSILSPFGVSMADLQMGFLAQTRLDNWTGGSASGRFNTCPESSSPSVLSGV